MNTVILVIWTTVGGLQYTALHGWRSIGEFSSIASCQAAARQLGVVDPSDYRCLVK